MRYMMLVCVEQPVELDPEELAAIGPATEAWVEEMEARHVRVQGHRLADVGDAATVRVRQGETLVTDGAFAETKECIAGFDILECASREEAIEVASKHPVARFGAIEVRAFWEG